MSNPSKNNGHNDRKLLFFHETNMVIKTEWNNALKKVHNITLQRRTEDTYFWKYQNFCEILCRYKPAGTAMQ
jgi:hypothetical protein